MYNEHFGLREAPFGITPDTSFFYASSRYQEALNTLLVAARNGEGFIKLTGEVVIPARQRDEDTLARSSPVIDCGVGGIRNGKRFWIKRDDAGY